MKPINNNYLSVDAKDIVDRHDPPRYMYKWSNKENQKSMRNPMVGASHGSHPPWDEQTSFFHQANEYPQGQMVRKHQYCKAHQSTWGNMSPFRGSKP